MLKIIPKPIEQDVIDQLEELLEMAKEGEIAAMGCCIVGTRGNVGRYFSGTKDTASLIGALRWLERDLIDRWIDNN